MNTTVDRTFEQSTNSRHLHVAVIWIIIKIRGIVKGAEVSEGQKSEQKQTILGLFPS